MDEYEDWIFINDNRKTFSFQDYIKFKDFIFFIFFLKKYKISFKNSNLLYKILN
jgi:hypothetical protein